MAVVRVHAAARLGEARSTAMTAQVDSNGYRPARPHTIIAGRAVQLKDGPRWSQTAAACLGVKGSQVRILSSRQKGKGPLTRGGYQVSGPFPCPGLIMRCHRRCGAWGLFGTTGPPR